MKQAMVHRKQELRNCCKVFSTRMLSEVVRTNGQQKTVKNTRQDRIPHNSSALLIEKAVKERRVFFLRCATRFAPEPPPVRLPAAPVRSGIRRLGSWNILPHHFPSFLLPVELSPAAMATVPALLLLASLIVLRASAGAAPNAAAVVSRIAFGSCANQSAPQPIWDAVAGFDPQLFIWLGDNVYGDNKRPFRVFGKERTVGPWKNVPRFYPSTEEELRRKYELAKAQPGYARLREKAQVIGTWDDHDYGLNDAGKEFSGKYFTQRLMLDFLDEAEDSPRRKQAGVYTSYMFGPEGRRVKVILLDTRYHRDPLSSDGTILGDPQWQWLERELHGPQSEITIIGSSIQVVSNLSATTGPLFYVESWARFPSERERLFRLIDSSKRNGVIFISGDVHFGEIARFDCGVQYPLYDVTSSGLTQSVEHSVPAVFRPLMRFLALVTPTTMRVLSPNCQYKSCSYGQPNFGAIEIDWNAVPQQIKLELRDVQGHFVHRVEFPISELQPSDVHAAKKQAHGFQRYCTLETALPWITRHRLALLFFGNAAAFFIAMVLLVFTCLSAGKKCKKE